MIRAKFRCLEITTKFDGTTQVKLGPVKRTGKDTENDAFWKYSPSGECTLGIQKGEPCPFEPGAYYYVDMEPGAGWRLWKIDENDYGTTVAFRAQSAPGLAWLNWGEFSVTLSSEAKGAREAMRPHGSNWKFTFTLAEPSDSP